MPEFQMLGEKSPPKRNRRKNKRPKETKQLNKIESEVKAVENTISVIKENAKSKIATPSVKKLTKGLKMSQAGRSWLHRYINPCHNDGKPCYGIPSGISSESAVLHSRVDQAISAPQQLVDLWDVPSGNDWYLGLIVPPWIDDCVILIASSQQPAQFDELSVIIETAPIYPIWNASDTTVSLSTVFYCKFPSPQVPTYLETVADTVQLASSFRVVGRGITTYLDADANNNRGSVSCAQWAAEKKDVTLYRTTNVSGVDVITSVDLGEAILFGEITPSEMANVAEQSVTHEAKKGMYMPVYHNDPEFEIRPFAYRDVIPLARKNCFSHFNLTDPVYTNVYNLDVAMTLTDDALPATVTLSLLDEGTSEVVATTTVTVTTASTAHAALSWTPEPGSVIYQTTPEFDVTTNSGNTHTFVAVNADNELLFYASDSSTVPSTVTNFTTIGSDTLIVVENIYEGSAIQPITPKIVNDKQNIGVIWYQAISGAASVRLKGRLTIQAVTQPASRWAGFTQPAAKSDPIALEAAKYVASTMQHGYPASYNDNGILGNLLKGLLNKVPVIGGLLSDMV